VGVEVEKRVIIINTPPVLRIIAQLLFHSKNKRFQFHLVLIID